MSQAVNHHRAVAVHDAFGAPGGAAGVKNQGGIFRADILPLEAGLLAAEDLTPGSVSFRYAAAQVIHLKPTSLVLAVGAAVVAAGLTGASELNGVRGRVISWDEEAGRYAVRLDGERRPKRLKPDNCRADVLAL